MRVLYVNHTGAMSGAEQSLLTLLDALPTEISPAVASPDGPFADAVRQRGLELHALPATEGSLRLHPLHTSVAVGALAATALALHRLARRLGSDVVHANSIRAGMAAALAARRGGPPAVVHVRDCLPPGLLSQAARQLIGRRAAAVVGNSRYTEERFAIDGLPAVTYAIHNAVDLERFDPSRIDRARARARLGLDGSAVVLAVLAQLTPWKAQDDAVRALSLLAGRHPQARLLLVGSAKFVGAATRYDNVAFVHSLERLIDDRGLGDRVILLGERYDVPEVLRAVDVLLVPSWEEPFGRSVGEGMAMGVPVVATRVGGPPELVVDGEEGLLLPPRDPSRWADALEPLMLDPALRERMGQAGRRRAERDLGSVRHAEQIASVYREALG